MSLLDVRDRLSEPQRQTAKKVGLFILNYLPVSTNLELLAIRHGTDKWQQGYIPHYRRHFRDLRRKPLTVLEIGIGTSGVRSGGDSLRMWRDYLPRARIFGVDILDKTVHDEARIKTLQGSQDDPVFLDKVGREYGPFDIIIDDGSHINAHVITSFRSLFPYLKLGGWYVIEDIITSYFSKFGGSSTDLNNPKTMMSLFKSLCDNVNSNLIPNRNEDLFDTISSAHFYEGIVFFSKDKKRIAERATAFLGGDS